MAQHMVSENKSTKRCVITKLVFRDFKSYSGSVEIEPFHQSFSAIVGANGSGKSNILDGLLFVFGKRTKKIRLNKLSELIHNSNSEIVRPNSAKVSVHISILNETLYPIIEEKNSEPNNEDKIRKGEDQTENKVKRKRLKISSTKENEETKNQQILKKEENFVISREAFKNNTSKYYINEKTVKFSELYEFLLKYNIDVKNNRFIILQGEIDSISMMKPKGNKEGEEGLLEYLEDLIGSDKYTEDISIKENELEKIGDLKKEKEKRFKVLENELNILEPQKENSMKILFRKKEFYEINKKIILLEIEEKKILHEKILKEIENNKKESNERKILIQNLEKEMKDLENEKEICEKGLKGKNKEFEDIKTSLTKLEEKDLEFEETMKYTKLNYKEKSKKLKEVKKEIEISESKKIEIEKNFNVLNEQIETLERNIEEIENSIEKILESKKEILIDSKSSLENKEKELSPFNNKMEIFKKEKIHLEKKLKDIKNYSIKYENEMNEIKENKEEIFSKLKSHEKFLNENENKLSFTKNSQKENSNKISVLQNELFSLSKKRAQIKEECENLSKLFEKQNSNFKDNVEKALNSFNINGFYGKLGSLGTIEAEFDAAISSASNAWNFYLVDNTQTAQKCIEFLREHRIGKATFLALDKQRKFFERMHKSILLPDGARRLFDLVEVSDERFLTAFCFALKDTLVVENIELATKIAYSSEKNNGRKETKWRIVTKKGELIEQSGTMTGGGGNVRRGLVNIKNNCSKNKKEEKNIHKEKMNLQNKESMKIKIENKRNEFENIVKECNRIKEEIENCNFNLQSFKSEIRNKELEIRKLKESKRMFDKQFDEIQKKENSYEIKNKEKLINFKKEETSLINQQNEIILKIEKEERESSKLIKEIEKYKQEIEKICGEKFKELNKDLIEYKNKQKENFEKKKDFEISLLNLPENILKLKKDFEDLEKQINNCIEKGKEINKEKREIEIKAKEIIEKSSSLEIEISQREKDIFKIKSEIKEKEKEIEKAKNEEEKIENSEKNILKKEKEISKSLYLKKEEFFENEEQWKELESLCKEIESFKNLNISPSPKSENINEKNDNVREKEESKENEQIGKEELKEKLEEIKKEIKEKVFNENIIKDFFEKQKELNIKKGDLESISKEYTETKEKYETAKKLRFSEFMKGFTLIASKMKEIYQTLTFGGDAELELIDSLDPFSEGIQLSVRPPKKSWKSVQNLSGGEKTLSSLALVFALHSYKVAPIYIMDEIDAALDFKNVSIVGSFVKKLSLSAQFIVVSLRNNMFELADRLVGVYKTENESKVLLLDKE